MVLGLYSGVPDYDYRVELARIAESGATAVSLQAIYRMERHDSVEVVRHPTSSPTEASLRRTFRQARERGLRMMFFPTINLRDEAANATWWRGNIEPRDWELWWRNYTAFNVRLAGLAQEEGVEWYSVGHRDGIHPSLSRPLAGPDPRRCGRSSRARSPTASTSMPTMASPSGTGWM